MKHVRYVLGCYLLYAAATCWAQPQLIERETPRTVGWLSGDVIEHRIVLQSPLDQPLIKASLPAAGPLNYWLTLRSVELSQDQGKTHHQYDIALRYQSFYVPLDVSVRQIPSFQLSFQSAAGSNTYQLDIPAWTFTMSPLRPVTLASSSELPVLQGDTLAILPTQDSIIQKIIALTLTLLLLVVLLCHHYRYWPFQQRRHRACAKAYRRVQGLRRQASFAHYQQALRCLHQALSELNNHATLLQEDLPLFVQQHPAFRSVEAELQHLFAATQQAFYNSSPLTQEALKQAWQSLLRCARALQQAERKEHL